MDEVNEISSIITVKNRLSSRLTGSFNLYRQEDDEIEATLLIKQHIGDDLRSSISARVANEHDVNSTMDVMYRGNGDVESIIEAVAVQYLESYIEVRPHNQMYGKFELLSAPKKIVSLAPIADATTRSREDLRTINYGDTRSMLTGQSDGETFGSFIQFADFENSIPDLKFIENTKLRLYYANFTNGSNLELHQPNTIWREMGVTDANKPNSVEKLVDQYTVNTVERYVEFDIKDVALRWQSKELDNYGFIISTEENERFTFFTRESDRSPLLIIEYITSQVFSIGRSELESQVFVYGAGRKDLSGVLTVKSTVGIEYLESSLYVHRIADPVLSDLKSNVAASRPDMFSTITVKIPANSSIDSLITVGYRKTDEISGRISVNRPELNSILVVSNHTKASNFMSGELIVKSSEQEEWLASKVSISKPDINSYLTVKAIDVSDLESLIEVPFYDNIDALFGYSKPQIDAELTVKYTSDTESYLYVKEKEYLESIIDVKNISEIPGSMIVKVFEQIDGGITINTPELFGWLSPRVSGENDLNAEILIKKRNVGDLNSYISVRGKGNRNFVIIF